MNYDNGTGLSLAQLVQRTIERIESLRINLELETRDYMKEIKKNTLELNMRLLEVLQKHYH
jgi:hypothetical protein